jgi:acetyl-CoA carboxylase biotin carboxylase subunit
VSLTGHAIQCRVTAESPTAGFRPAPGRIEGWSAPRGPGIRVDTHCHEGYTVPPFYDSLLAKLVVHGDDRAQATERLQKALRRFRVTGLDTTVGFLSYVTEHSDFACGRFNTRWVEDNLVGFGVD